MKGSLGSYEDLKMFTPWMVLMLKLWMNIWWNWPIISFLLTKFVFIKIGIFILKNLLLKNNHKNMKLPTLKNKLVVDAIVGFYDFFLVVC